MHQDTPHASYTFYDNGIHEFVFKDNSRQAADDVLGWLESLYASVTSEQTLLELADISGGLPPISYLARRARDLVKPFKVLPRVRVALLYKTSTAMSLLSMIVNLVTVSNATMRQFQVTDREAAIQWLLNK
jgi:hypothetical protein